MASRFAEIGDGEVRRIIIDDLFAYILERFDDGTGGPLEISTLESEGLGAHGEGLTWILPDGRRVMVTVQVE